jgi:hypothetical protein
MKISGWKHTVALSCGLLAVAATSAGAAQPSPPPFADAGHVVYTPARGAILPKAAGDVTYHNGPVIVSAKVVFLFWGPSFSNAASPDFVYAQTLQSFRNQLGTSSSWQVVTQYSGIQLTNLGSGTPDWFDISTPPTNVTDARVQGEVNAYLASHAFNNSAIYEVVIPSTSYSSDGAGDTSCGGPNLQYCTYHSWFTKGSSTVKYTIQPYPSCSGCQVSGWSTAQDQEHFICFETRDVVTDPTGLGWYDNQFGEICEKCAWSPSPFFPPSFSTICGTAWSNKVHRCV